MITATARSSLALNRWYLSNIPPEDQMVPPQCTPEADGRASAGGNAGDPGGERGGLFRAASPGAGHCR